jgi:hypothetical protein
MARFGYDEIWEALERLIALQSHEASLLNSYDGGKRYSYKNATEYLLRIRQIENKEWKEKKPND